MDVVAVLTTKKTNDARSPSIATIEAIHTRLDSHASKKAANGIKGAEKVDHICIVQEL